MPLICKTCKKETPSTISGECAGCRYKDEDDAASKYKDTLKKVHEKLTNMSSRTIYLSVGEQSALMVLLAYDLAEE